MPTRTTAARRTTTKAKKAAPRARAVPPPKGAATIADLRRIARAIVTSTSVHDEKRMLGLYADSVESQEADLRHRGHQAEERAVEPHGVRRAVACAQPVVRRPDDHHRVGGADHASARRSEGPAERDRGARGAKRQDRPRALLLRPVGPPLSAA